MRNTKTEAKTFHLQKDFGIRKSNLKRKFEKDRDGMDKKWEDECAALLSQTGNDYTADEVKVLALTQYTAVDRAILKDPDRYNHLQVRTAQKNSDRYDAVMEVLSQRTKPSAKEKGAAKKQDGGSKPNLPEGVVQSRVNAGRFDIMREGKVVGQIWRNRQPNPDGGVELRGWIHTHSRQIHTGDGSKRAAVDSLLAAVDG